jgi:TRAP-type C4-dicarboxylate transport system permease small subunit
MSVAYDTGPEPAKQPGGGFRLLKVFDSIIYSIARIADQLSAVICAALIIVTTGAVIVYQLGIVVVWLDDVLRMLIIWLVYLGSVALCLDNDHISMDALYLRMPLGIRKVMDVIIAIMGITICTYVAMVGYSSMMQEIAYGTFLSSGYVPSWPQSLAIPLCFGLMAVAYLSYLFSVFTGRRHRELTEEQKMVEGL